jgi:hypothetical protein
VTVVVIAFTSSKYFELLGIGTRGVDAMQQEESGKFGV